jgi:hypothetical protein
MKHPEAFSVLYGMSSCCLMNDPQRLLPGAAANQPPSGALAKALSAQAAAWAPNPMNPPQFFDLPTRDGEIQPLITAKWVTNSPLVMVDQYVRNLKRYRAIAIDVGTKDPFLTQTCSWTRPSPDWESHTDSRSAKAIMGTASRPVSRRRCCHSFQKISPRRSDKFTCGRRFR